EVPAAEKDEPPAEADATPEGAPAPEATAEAEAVPSEPPTESEPAETPPADEPEPAAPPAGTESSPAEPEPEKAEAAEPPSPAGTLRIELPPFRQKRVVVSLLKGGVGKTTITCFLATALQKIWDDAASDGRVLVVDTDPQGSATDFFLEGAPVSPERSLRALFAPYPFPGPELIQHTRYSRIDLIAAHPSMAEVAATADDRLEDHLAWYLANAANDYSLILLDTPPSNTLALRNALMASSGIFMPLDPSRQSLKTFVQFSQTVKRYKDRNRALQIYGVIFSRYDSRQSLDRNIRDTISAQLAGSGLRLYEIPRRAAIADSYNNYTGYEALSPSKEADALRTFHDLAMQVLAR
ncbi:MAG: AAA family ATPase, partial [Pyramidobacter sp.]|nr:AAA family ATPase [Pyramidobacter sp.]